LKKKPQFVGPRRAGGRKPISPTGHPNGARSKGGTKKRASVRSAGRRLGFKEGPQPDCPGGGAQNNIFFFFFPFLFVGFFVERG